MRCIRYVVVAGTLLLLSGYSFAQLVNGGFESGTLPPWKCIADACTVETFAPHTGNNHVSGVANAGDGDLHQGLATVAGTMYTVSAYVATNGATTNTVSLGLGGSAPFACAPLTGSYALCTANFLALTDNDHVHVYFTTIVGSGTVLIDDVSVLGQFAVAPVATPVPAMSDAALAVLAALLMLAAGLHIRKSRLSA